MNENNSYSNIHKINKIKSPNEKKNDILSKKRVTSPEIRNIQNENKEK